jgi:hypothetical protein
MAAGQPPRGEDNTAPRTVPPDCFRGVFRAAWQEAARGRQQRRYEQLIAAYRSTQRQAQHPRTILPVHLITPAWRPTNAREPQHTETAMSTAQPKLRTRAAAHRGGVASPGQPNMRDCDQVLPTLRFRVNPAHRGIGSADHRARHYNEPRYLAGTTTKEKSERTSDLTTPLSGKSRLVGRDDRGDFAFGAAKTRPIRSLSARNPRWGLRAELFHYLVRPVSRSQVTTLTRA